MDKFKLNFLILQIKSLLGHLPMIAASIVLFAALAAATAFCAKSGGKGIYFNIGTVLPDDDPMINMGYNLLTSMDSLKEYCNFVRTDLETARQMLREGKLYGVVVLPEHFVEDVLSGRNTPAKILLPSSPGMEASLLKAVVNSGSSTLAYAQSGVYALSDALRMFGNGNNIDAAMEGINMDYVKFVVNRGSIFDEKILHAADRISTAEFFMCSAITIIIILVFMTSGSYILQENGSLLMLLDSHGMKPSTVYFCKLFCMTFVYGTIFAVIYLISQSAGMTACAAGFAGIYATSLLTAACSMLIFSRTGGMTYGILVMFTLSLTMMFISGSILPAAYLPKAFAPFKYLPTGYMHRLIQAIFCGNIEFADITGALVYTALFTGLSRKAKP